jgi:predicted nucleic acid-binding protein
MRIYFDNCCLQRPLDDQTQPRIEAETKAIIAILSFCEHGRLTLVSSEILELEINEDSDLERRKTSLGIIDAANEMIFIDTQIENRAEEFEKSGIKPFDALHLASAEIARTDYFCTCDDKLLKKAKAQNDLKIKVVSPIELFEEVSK